MQKIIKTILVFMLMLASIAALANDQSLSQIRQRSEIVVAMDILYGINGISKILQKMKHNKQLSTIKRKYLSVQ